MSLEDFVTLFALFFVEVLARVSFEGWVGSIGEDADYGGFGVGVAVEASEFEVFGVEVGWWREGVLWRSCFCGDC